MSYCFLLVSTHRHCLLPRRLNIYIFGKMSEVRPGAKYIWSPALGFPSLSKLLENRQQVGAQGWSASRVISRVGLGLHLQCMGMTEALALIPLAQSRGDCLPSRSLHQASILTFFCWRSSPQRMPGTWVASCSAVRPLKRVTVEPLLCSDLQGPLQRSLPWQAVCH